VSVLIYLVAPLVLAVLIIAVRSYRRRRPTSIEANLREFRRGLDALDPANDPLRRTPDRKDRRDG
jgi:hypothetical protein